MSVFGKIKNVLFTEEEETEEIPVIRERHVEQPSVEEEITRFKNIKFEEPVNVSPVKEQERIEEPIVERPVIKPVVEEKSPFQSFDEEEFDRIAAINKTRLIERDRRLREEKARENKLHEQRMMNTKKEVRTSFVKEQPKFVPSPVISPVYGILDKNYSKDDILPRASSDGTLPKIMDVDKVRQKAFGTLETIEKNIKDDLSDVKITSFEDEVEKNNVKIVDDVVEKVEIEDTKPLPVVEEEENMPTIEAAEPVIEDIIEDEKKKDEEIENDLFELIDSMYQNEEGE